MSVAGRFPRLYAIADAGVLGARGVSVRAFAEGMRAAGVELLQYRDKAAGPQGVLRNAAVIREVMAGSGCRLILNDRADLAVLAGWDGVHVGQGDLSVADARRVVGVISTHPSQGREGWGTRTVGAGQDGVARWVGVSTHTDEQVRAAVEPMSESPDMGHPDSFQLQQTGADYIAIGPVFATGTKVDAEAVVGLEGVRRARALTAKPLVAIGGITRANARSVVEAGADSVAVISGLFAAGETVEQVARDFLELLR